MIFYRFGIYLFLLSLAFFPSFTLLFSSSTLFESGETLDNNNRKKCTQILKQFFLKKYVHMNILVIKNNRQTRQKNNKKEKENENKRSVIAERHEQTFL